MESFFPTTPWSSHFIYLFIYFFHSRFLLLPCSTSTRWILHDQRRKKKRRPKHELTIMALQHVDPIITFNDRRCDDRWMKIYVYHGPPLYQRPHDRSTRVTHASLAAGRAVRLWNPVLKMRQKIQPVSELSRNNIHRLSVKFQRVWPFVKPK